MDQNACYISKANKTVNGIKGPDQVTEPDLTQQKSQDAEDRRYQDRMPPKLEKSE